MNVTRTHWLVAATSAYPPTEGHPITPILMDVASASSTNGELVVDPSDADMLRSMAEAADAGWLSEPEITREGMTRAHLVVP